MNLDLNKYKNIIFDLGGVILNIDYKLTVEAFKKLGLADFDKLYSQANQSSLFDAYEVGKISSEKFIDEMQNIIGMDISKQSIVEAWNAMLLDLPGERVALLNNLKNNYRIFLLSNTNEIHKIAYCNYLKKTFGFNDLSNLFEKQYLSFEIGLRKPHKETFEYVIADAGIIKEETLFIDDSVQHVVGAKEAGIDAFHLTDGNTILDLFKAK